jgi:single-strand DNA-binding protein
MNTCLFIGRLVTQPELKHTQSNIPFLNINIAVNRKYANDSGEREADFLPLVFWRKQAELVNEHFSKGSQIAVQTHVVTRSYESDNGTRYVTEFHVDELDFLDPKKPAEEKHEIKQTKSGVIKASDIPTPKPDDNSELPF